MAMEAGDIDNFKATELRLGLPGTHEDATPSPRGNKRAHEEAINEEGKPRSSCTKENSHESTAPPAKAQVVGWPPVRSYRKNCFQAAKKAVEAEAAAGGLFVKVSMDGAPYLRKIDLKVYMGYKDLQEAFEAMFKCFSIGFSGREGYNNSEYAITYEDKDGDWMLAGDVPWEMFTSSCKRLRIMRSSEARGLGSTS